VGTGGPRRRADHLDADFRFTAAEDFPEPAQDLDVDGVRGFWRRFLGQWALVRITADEIVAAGDRALVAVTQTGVGRTSGAETDMRYFLVWHHRVPRRRHLLAHVGLSRRRRGALPAVRARTDGRSAVAT
jgi:hypothetical protein